MKRLVIVTCLLLASAIGCITIQAPAGTTPTTPTPTPTPTPTTPPQIVVFNASPSSISSGGSATLLWTTSGANLVSIDQSVGTVPTSGTISVSPATSTIYTLTATNAVGMSATATAQIVVSGAPSPPTPAVLPVINSFTANPPIISAGGTSTLSWSVSNATSVTIDTGVGSVGSVGTAPVSPAATTNYTLTASNAVGSFSQTITVMVSSASPSPSVADLRITTGSPTATPSTVAPGGTVTLSAWTVKNEGTAPSGDFSNGFYLSTNSVITTGDTLLTWNDNTNLAPGAQFNWGGPTLTIPPGTAPGNYYIGIIVDRANAVAESNENNNYVSRLITVSAPSPLADLRITTGSPTVTPSTVAAGGTVSLSAWTVKNEGTANSSPFSNGFYLSTNSVITTGDTLLTWNDNTNLAPGAQFNWGGPTLTIPPGTAPGNYYIGIIVDRANAVAESNEGNNYVSRLITVSAPSPLADLRITTGSPTATPSTVAAGGHVTLSAWTVKNEGTAPSGDFSNGFYLSTNSVITTGDTLLTWNSNSNLAPGAQFNWGGPTLTIPPGTAPGNYYIGIIVDRANAVAESNENNNYVSRLITVH